MFEVCTKAKMKQNVTDQVMVQIPCPISTRVVVPSLFLYQLVPQYLSVNRLSGGPIYLFRYQLVPMVLTGKKVGPRGKIMLDQLVPI